MVLLLEQAGVVLKWFDVEHWFTRCALAPEHDRSVHAALALFVPAGVDGILHGVVDPRVVRFVGQTDLGHGLLAWHGEPELAVDDVRRGCVIDLTLPVEARVPLDPDASRIRQYTPEKVGVVLVLKVALLRDAAILIDNAIEPSAESTVWPMGR